MKYTITVQELTLTFYTNINIDINKLTQFLDAQLSELAAKQDDVILQFQQLTQSKGDTNSIYFYNSVFTEFMTLLVSLIEKYHETVTLKEPRNVSGIKNYVFKVPRKSTVFDKHWVNHFKELESFKKEFGHITVSRTTKGYDQLGNWLADQRRKLRRGKLTEQQYEMLNQLGVDWDRAAQFGQANSMIFAEGMQ